MTEPTEPQDAPELIPVRVLATEGRSSLVEIEGPRRYYVPTSKINNNHVSAGTLIKAIEYGIRWESFLDLDESERESLAGQLRNAGIWTRYDLTARDRRLLRMSIDGISNLELVTAVFSAAHRAEKNKLPRRNKNAE